MHLINTSLELRALIAIESLSPVQAGFILWLWLWAALMQQAKFYQASRMAGARLWSCFVSLVSPLSFGPVK